MHLHKLLGVGFLDTLSPPATGVLVSLQYFLTLGLVGHIPTNSFNAFIYPVEEELR